MIGWLILAAYVATTAYLGRQMWVAAGFRTKDTRDRLDSVAFIVLLWPFVLPIAWWAERRDR